MIYGWFEKDNKLTGDNLILKTSYKISFELSSDIFVVQISV
jgi:hypothetical protein